MQQRKRIAIVFTYFVPCWSHLRPPTWKDHYLTFQHHETLFQSFHNKHTITEEKDTNYKEKEKKIQKY